MGGRSRQPRTAPRPAAGDARPGRAVHPDAHRRRLIALLALPVILWQLYAFSIGERRVALPLMAMAPLLFMAGMAFGYFVVLPGAVGFLQSFNASSFDALV